MMAAINDTIHEQREIGFDKVLELDAAVTRVVLWSSEHEAAHQLQLLLPLPPDYPRTAASPAAWQPPPGPGTIALVAAGADPSAVCSPARDTILHSLAAGGREDSQDLVSGHHQQRHHRTTGASTATGDQKYFSH